MPSTFMRGWILYDNNENKLLVIRMRVCVYNDVCKFIFTVNYVLIGSAAFDHEICKTDVHWFGKGFWRPIDKQFYNKL